MNALSLNCPAPTPIATTGLPTERWRIVWREGFVPSLTREQLESLRLALATDDPRLSQGSTTVPPPLMCVADWPVEAACALGYCGWQGGASEHKNVGQVEEQFARLCYECDQRLGQGACRWFLNWFDDMPRPEMLRELLAEVTENLAALDRLAV